LRARATRLAAALREGGAEVEVTRGSSAVGGGAYPEAALQTAIVSLLPPHGADALAAALRAASPPIVATVGGGRVRLDPRTVLEEEEEALVRGVLGALVA
jgi:L-seryl-tRNA(Ser) seleniumtransferase